MKLGDELPAYQVAGWLNGPPPAFGAAGVRVTVVDIWSSWCPFCRTSAPELVALHAKYAGRGVAFVSLTDMSEGAARSFHETARATWPSGYGMPREAIAAFGAGNSAAAVPGYDVAPTVYLVDPDGRVRWTDRRARMAHTDPAEFGRMVGAAIDRELAAKPPGPKEN